MIPRTQLNDAITSAIQSVEPSMVTKWVVLVETIDTDGDRGLWTVANEGATPWDSLGLLQHAVHLEQARTFRMENEK